MGISDLTQATTNPQGINVQYLPICLRVYCISLLLYTKVSSTILENLPSGLNTLDQLHVVFRHGDRTPDSLYPNDPYTPDTFYPEGVGQLTNNGKQTEYDLGKSLRKKYGKFLGDVYTPQSLYCVASHYPRTKTSLQLVLAGLYPPPTIQRWSDELNWQPIPCDYMKKEENTIFMPYSVCPNFDNLREQELLKSTTEPIYKKYKSVIPYLNEKSGFVNKDLFYLGVHLYSTLLSEEEYGLDLPSWTKPVYPHILKDIASMGMKYYAGVGKLKILQPGYLMSQIVNNTYSTINEDASVNGRKLFLYSGHDINIASIMYFLDKLEPRIINYGSHIIIEVHKIHGIRFFRFLIENYNYATPEPIYVPNCGYLCPIDVFAELYADVLDPIQLHQLCYN